VVGARGAAVCGGGGGVGAGELEGGGEAGCGVATRAATGKRKAGEHNAHRLSITRSEAAYAEISHSRKIACRYRRVNTPWNTGVLVAGLEPARAYAQRCVRSQRLPVSPHQHLSGLRTPAIPKAKTRYPTRAAARVEHNRRSVAKIEDQQSAARTGNIRTVVLNRVLRARARPGVRSYRALLGRLTLTAYSLAFPPCPSPSRPPLSATAYCRARPRLRRRAA
jgi:hypothetical protein